MGEITGDAPLFAIAAPGLEPAVEAELRALGFADIEPEEGGVAFVGSPLRANRGLASATRVLQRVARFRARTFDQLRAGAAAVDWAPFGGLTPRAASHRSRLYHTAAIAERLAEVVPPGDGELLARLSGDVCTLSVDTSGERLHKRGWRLESGPAPLRETLAAGLLRLAGWAPGEALYDPMCGSGTLLVEAAIAAAGRPPGGARGFACERWRPPEPLPPGPWPAAPTLIAGSDRARPAVDAARRNAERAAVDLPLAVLEAAHAPAPAASGLLVCNPPYGRRAAAVRHAFERLALALAGPFAGWRAAVLCPDRGLEPVLGRAVEARFPLQNGGVRVELIRLARCAGDVDGP